MANLFQSVVNKIKSFAQSTQTEDAKVTENGRVIADHPSNQITPAKLKSLFDDAENGDLTAQHELFMDIEERDSDIGANIATRKRAILTLPWQIKAPVDATPVEEKWLTEITGLFNRIGYLDDLLMDCMDAVGHGFSAMEIEWHLIDGKQLPLRFLHRPQSWFRFDKDDKLLVKTPDNVLGEPLRPFGWVVHTHKSRSIQQARMGLFRSLAWLYMFKHYSVHDFAEFLELYGMPIRIGKYGAGATESEKRTLLRALAQIGHNAAGIMPESMKIELHNAANNAASNNPFLQMIDWCEKSIARLILGQTLTSGADGKSSTNALGNVHNEVRRDLLISDAKQVAQTLTQQVILAYLQINVDPNIDASRIPYFEFDTTEYEDLAKFADALPKLVNVGVQISEKWVRNKLGIPEPQEGERLLISGLNPVLNPDNAALKQETLTHHLDKHCPCGCQSAVLSGQLEVEDSLLPDDTLNAQMLPLINSLADAFAKGTDYESAFALASQAYPQLDDKVLIACLSRALFVSDIWERIRGQQG